MAATRAGRTPKLTPAVKDVVVKLVGLGLHWSSAPVARAAGVSTRTIRHWVRLGREQDRGVYRDFVAALADADARRLEAALEAIKAAGCGYDETTTRVTTHPDGTTTTVATTRRVFEWQAAAWYLERSFPELFGRNQVDLADVTAAVRKIERDRRAAEADAKAAADEAAYRRASAAQPVFLGPTTGAAVTAGADPPREPDPAFEAQPDDDGPPPALFE